MNTWKVELGQEESEGIDFEVGPFASKEGAEDYARRAVQRYAKCGVGAKVYANVLTHPADGQKNIDEFYGLNESTFTLTDPIKPYNHESQENRRRVEEGERAVRTFAANSYGLSQDREDWPMAVTDLIADILHFALERGLEPRSVVSRSLRSFGGDFEDEDWDESPRARELHTAYYDI